MMKRFLTILVLFVSIVSFAYPQRSDLTGIKICIDPGHGGYDPADDRRLEPDPGNVFWESESNFQKALLLKSLLEAKGATVLLTRTSNDVEPSTSARWQFANANNVDWFHSIHSNATNLPLGQNLTTNYTLVLVKEDISTRQAAWPQAVTMSNLIGPSIQRKLRTTPRSTFTYLDYTFYGGPPNGYNLGVLSGLAMPGELSEGSFHDNYVETRRLLNNGYRKMEAYALRDAFLQYYGAPADTLCIVAGILTNSVGAPINGVRVRILPENVLFSGDNFNNGFYMLDGLRAGIHTLSFETPGFTARIEQIALEPGRTSFYDRSFEGRPVAGPAVVKQSWPTARDTAYPANQLIAVEFKEAMDTASFQSAFTIIPPVAGTVSWHNNLTLFWFKPAEPFPKGIWFTYRIEGSVRTQAGGLLDGNGDGLPGDAFSVTFKTEPALVSVETQSELALNFSLGQNYPNPFNPSTAISYQLPAPSARQTAGGLGVEGSAVSFVSLKVYDLLGREIATIVSEVQSAGTHLARWNGRNDRGESVTSGMYLYQLRAGSLVITRKMLLLR
jgi:N-acetylmuramoyl-L-alanine amidase